MKTKMQLVTFLPMLAEEIKKSLASRLQAHNVVPETAIVKRVECETKAEEANDDERSVTAYISTRNVDRDKEIVMPDGVDLTQFKINPVIMEGHNYSKNQVGKADNVRRDEYGIKAKITFAGRDVLGDGAVDYYLMSKFMPLKFSIGFIPLDIMREDSEEWKGMLHDLGMKWPEFKKGRNELRAIHRKSILLEASVTPMPSNIFAGQSAKMIEDAITEGKITAEDARIVRKSFDTAMPEPIIDDVDGISESDKAWIGLIDKNLPLTKEGLEKAKSALSEIAKKQDRLFFQSDPPPEPVVRRVSTVKTYSPSVRLVMPSEEHIMRIVKNALDMARGAV